MTASNKRIKILIVDDDPANIWSLIENLEDEYEILYATDGKKALHISFSDDRPDLIMLDVMMPDMDGYEVCSRLKANEFTREIPVIFLTAKAEEHDETRGLKLGAQDFITKPFSLPVVRARIKSILNLKLELDRRLLLKTQLEMMNSNLERQVAQKVSELNEARRDLESYEKRYTHLFREQKTFTSRASLLLVDDNPDNIHLLAASLEKNYDVSYATSGKDALEIAFGETPPDLILLDVMMPGMDGYEVCSRLKANSDTWHIPVIFVTALDQELDETRGLNLGAVDFIIKPFSMPIVEARIRAALRLKEEMDNRIALTFKLEELNLKLEHRVREKTAELEKAHVVIQESEELLRATLESTLEGVLVVDAEGGVSHYNKRFAEIWGIPKDVLEASLDNTLLEYVLPKLCEPDLFLSRVQEIYQTSKNFEDTLYFKDGRVLDRFSAPLTCVNREIGRVWFFRDITERVHNEEIIKRSLVEAEEARDKINAILKSIPHSLIVIDQEQKILLVNHAAESFLGCSQLELFRRPIGEVVKEERFLRSLSLAVSGTEPLPDHDLELMDQGKGEVRNVLLVTSLIRSKNEAKGGAVIALVDVTRDREIVRMKTEFISTAAHELRTPLTSVMGYAQLLLDRDAMEQASEAEKREYLNLINEKGRLLETIISELLQLSHAESGRPMLLEKSPFNVQNMINKVVKCRQLETQKHHFIVQHPDKEILLFADQSKIVQVLDNLITNAIKYSPDGGPLTIEYSKKGNTFTLVVSDNGIGMSPEQVERAFEKFYRADTSNTAVGGLGLGLSISKNIIEAHGGSICVESNKGKGTSVSVSIPVRLSPESHSNGQT